MKKYNALLFTIFSAVLFLQQTPIVLALETIYPNLGSNAPVVTNQTSLPEYIKYFFIFAVISAGIIGVISIVIGGVKILIFSGSSSSVTDGKDRIFGAILGITLLMLSYIILTTINPDFTNPTAEEYQLTPGVYLVGDDPEVAGRKIYESAPFEATDVSTINPLLNRIYYYCPPDSNGPTLLVWFYNETDFSIDRSANGDPNVRTRSIPCGDDENNSLNFREQGGQILSFRLDFQDSGIYYYLMPGCGGISSCAKGIGSDSCAQKSSGDIPDFDDNYDDQSVKSMKIVSGSDIYARYGVVLNKNYGHGGECSQPIINPTPGEEGICIEMDDPRLVSGGEPLNPFSAHIITQSAEPETAGLGVWLYSSNKKTRLIRANEINSWYTYNGDPETHSLGDRDGNVDNLLNNEGINQENAGPITQACFRGPVDNDLHTQTCLSEIDPGSGSYNIFLYVKDVPTNNKTCKLYTGYRVEFIDGMSPFNAGREPYRIDIIPKP